MKAEALYRMQLQRLLDAATRVLEVTTQNGLADASHPSFEDLAIIADEVDMILHPEIDDD